MLTTDKDKPLSGKALNKKIYDEAFDVKKLKEETTYVSACFAAGTLVHTDKGLIPIQNIKVGDKVLSRDENNPNGELVYKSVLKTIKTPNQEVFRLSYWARNQYDADEPIINYIIATRDHPIWNEAQERWCPLIDMEIGNMLSISNKTDTTYHFLCNNKMYQSSNSKGVLYGFCERPLKDYLPVEIHTIFEVTDEKIISYYNPLHIDKFQPTNGLTLSYEERCDIARNSLDEALLCDVYNIEVEDCHTYFVGEEGVWVHNTNGCFSEDELLDNLNNEGFMRSPEAKAFHGESMPVTTKDEILEGTKPVTKGKELYHSAYVSADAQKILNLNPSHYADLATDKENPLSGEALNKKIYNEAFDINELKLETKHNACFVAGTLVHTDKGLVPIEKLKVGDMVLSRHENDPNGELAYKRVLSTFKSKEKEKIIYVNYLTERGSGYFFCTENHPFWIDTLIEHKILEDGKEVVIRDAIGWEQAIKLDGCSQHSLRTFDGKIAYVNTFEDDRKILGTLPGLSNYALLYNTEEAIGIVDFNEQCPVIIDGKDTTLEPLTYISTSGLLKSEKTRMLIHSKNVDEYQKIKNAGINFEEIYEDYVYNIEVEDYHTYFVGDTGIWVHNTDSCFTELVTVNPKVTKAGNITTVNVKTGNSSDYQEFINNLDLSSGCSR